MSPAVRSKPSKVGSEKYSTVEAQDKKFSVLVMNMFKDPGEVMNKLLNEICEITTEGNKTKTKA